MLATWLRVLSWNRFSLLYHMAGEMQVIFIKKRVKRPLIFSKKRVKYPLEFSEKRVKYPLDFIEKRVNFL